MFIYFLSGYLYDRRSELYSYFGARDLQYFFTGAREPSLFNPGSPEPKNPLGPVVMYFMCASLTHTFIKTVTKRTRQIVNEICIGNCFFSACAHQCSLCLFLASISLWLVKFVLFSTELYTLSSPIIIDLLLFSPIDVQLCIIFNNNNTDEIFEVWNLNRFTSSGDATLPRQHLSFQID